MKLRLGWWVSLAAFGPTRLLVMVYISVSAVTAAYGFALTASPFGKRRSAGPAQSNQRSRPGVRPLAQARRSLIWGHRLRPASLRPPLDACGSVAPAPPAVRHSPVGAAEGCDLQGPRQRKIKRSQPSAAPTPPFDCWWEFRNFPTRFSGCPSDVGSIFFGLSLKIQRSGVRSPAISNWKPALGPP